MIHRGDALTVLKTLPSESVNCVVTSTPYFNQRDYSVEGQIGLEETPEEYVAKLVEVFHEVRRVLRDDGTLWLNLGDSYNGSGKGQTKDGIVDKKRAKERGMRLAPSSVSGLKPKDLIGVPWMVAVALRSDGWWLRQDIIWHKLNPMPESVMDRCVKAHEYVFLMSKNKRYYFDHKAIQEPSVTFEGRPAGVVRDREYGYDSKQKAMGRHTGIRFGGNKYGDSQDPKYATKSGKEYVDSGKRNKRSVWSLSSQPFTMTLQTSHLHHVVQGASSDGMKCIVFPNCREHEDFLARETTALCDEHVDDVLSRIERIGGCLSQEQVDDFVPTVKRLVVDSWQRNSGYARLLYSISAMHRNSEAHRRAPALLTNVPCISFGRTLARIDDKQDALLLSVLYLGMNGNKTSLDGLDARLLAKMPHYTADKSSCSSCPLYQVNNEKTSHCAVFPESLVEPMLLAGCPKGGVVLDPFAGAGTVGVVAKKLGREFVGIELNPEYVRLAEQRIADTPQPML